MAPRADAGVDDLFPPEMPDLAEAEEDMSRPDMARPPDGLSLAFSPLTFNTSVKSTALGVTDFDGDGRPDVAIGGWEPQVALHRNAPGAKPSLDLTSTIAVAQPFANDLLVGDFNADQLPDVVVAFGSPSSVSVLLGDGAFHFKEVNSSLAFEPLVLRAWDFDGDGLTDLAIAEEHQGMSSLRLLRNTGAGKFAETRSLSLGQYGGEAAMGDLNGDGKVDIVVPNSVSVLVFTGRGGFDFGGPQSFQVPPPADAVALGSSMTTPLSMSSSRSAAPSGSCMATAQAD